MSTKDCKQIAFDLDTNELKKFYKSISGAYDKLERFLIKRGFEKVGRSVFMSKEPMTDFEVYILLDDLALKCPWLETALSNMTITNKGNIGNCSKFFKLKKY